jgi:hypothetical protein
MVRNHGIWGFPLDSQTIPCGLRVRFRPSLRQPFVAESMTKSPADSNTILVPRISVWAVKNPPVNIQQDVENPAFLRIIFQGNNGFSTSMWIHPIYKLLGVPKFEPNHTQPDLWKQKAGCPQTFEVLAWSFHRPRCQATGKPTSSPVPGACLPQLWKSERIWKEWAKVRSRE